MVMIFNYRPGKTLIKKHASKLMYCLFLIVPEKPEPENQEKDIESRPETNTCNGSASRKICKHQSKREQRERQRELLKQQEEAPNQEDGQDSGNEGDDTNTEEKLRMLKQQL